jgi:hypothetical protein
MTERVDFTKETERLTYIAMIRNSVNSTQYNNRYAIVNGCLSDITGDGSRSCAFFVSHIIQCMKMCTDIHTGIEGLLTDLQGKDNGWYTIDDINDRVSGDVVIWEPKLIHGGYNRHVGFFLGEDSEYQCISTCPYEKHVIWHDMTFKGTRSVEFFLTNALLHNK